MDVLNIIFVVLFVILILIGLAIAKSYQQKLSTVNGGARRSKHAKKRKNKKYGGAGDVKILTANDVPVSAIKTSAAPYFSIVDGTNKPALISTYLKLFYSREINFRETSSLAVDTYPFDTYLTTISNPSFIASHLNQYDIIHIIPDSGRSNYSDKNKLFTLLPMLKTNGMMIFGPWFAMCDMDKTRNPLVETMKDYNPVSRFVFNKGGFGLVIEDVQQAEEIQRYYDNIKASMPAGSDNIENRKKIMSEVNGYYGGNRISVELEYVVVKKPTPVIRTEPLVLNNAIIFCHTSPVTGTIANNKLSLTGHFYGDERVPPGVNQILNNALKTFKMTGTPKIDTVDLYTGAATYSGVDAFSEEFITSHLNQYDLVMIPDCSGKYRMLTGENKYEIVDGNYKTVNQPGSFYPMLKSSADIQTDINSFKELVLSVVRLVKTNGVILFDALPEINKYSTKPFTVDGKTYVSVQDMVCDVLNKNNFKAFQSQSPYVPTNPKVTCVVAQKDF